MNWKERIARAKKDGIFTDVDRNLSTAYACCAVGEAVSTASECEYDGTEDIEEYEARTEETISSWAPIERKLEREGIDASVYTTLFDRLGHLFNGLGVKFMDAIKEDEPREAERLRIEIIEIVKKAREDNQKKT